MSAPTGRRLARALWPVMIAWMALVAWRAHAELTADYVVEGLFRSYRSPHPVVFGGTEAAVVDPRPEATLRAELIRRYAPESGLDPAGPDPVDEAGWRALLAALGLDAKPHTADVWPGAPPRLRLGEAGPHLLIGLFGVDPVAVVPGVGVVRIPEGALPPATLDLALPGARERPW